MIWLQKLVRNVLVFVETIMLKFTKKKKTNLKLILEELHYDPLSELCESECLFSIWIDSKTMNVKV